MKKIIIISLLFLSLCSFGQMGRYPFYTVKVSAVSNMLSNGTFDNTDDWTFEAEWAIADGVATHIYVSDDYCDLYQTDGQMVLSLEPSTSYTLTFNLTATYWMDIRLYNSDRNIRIDSGVDHRVYSGAGVEITFTTPADIGTGGFCIRALSVGVGGTDVIDNLALIQS